MTDLDLRGATSNVLHECFTLNYLSLPLFFFKNFVVFLDRGIGLIVGIYVPMMIVTNVIITC